MLINWIKVMEGLNAGLEIYPGGTENYWKSHPGNVLD